MPFSAKRRVPEAEATSVDAELEQLEAELGSRLIQQAEDLSRRYPPDSDRVLSGLGLALAQEGSLARRNRNRWSWTAAACLLAVLAAAGWLLAPAPHQVGPSVAQRGSQPTVPAAAWAEGESGPAGVPVPRAPAPATSEEEQAPAWLLSSEELEGIADLEQPGFALGI